MRKSAANKIIYETPSSFPYLLSLDLFVLSCLLFQPIASGSNFTSLDTTKNSTIMETGG